MQGDKWQVVSALSLILILGATFFFPLMSKMRDSLESQLTNSPFAHTMQNENIQKLMIAGAAMAFPSFIADIFHCVTHRCEFNTFLRIFFSVNVIATLLLEVASYQSSNPLACIYCLHTFLAWIFIMIPFFMCLHYLQKYRLSHFIIVLMSVYFYYMSDLFHLIYSHKNAVSLTFQASRVVIVVTLFIAY